MAYSFVKTPDGQGGMAIEPIVGNSVLVMSI